MKLLGLLCYSEENLSYFILIQKEKITLEEYKMWTHSNSNVYETKIKLGKCIEKVSWEGILKK